MDDDELRLNSISRYSKRSDQYVLEVHSHCEVPAGCGGAVLRWRNPRTSIPLEIWTFTSGEAEMLLDGEPLASGRPLVSYGEHVLCWRITGFDLLGTVLTCSATYGESPPVMHISTIPPTGQVVSILSAADDTWRYTFAPPPGTWTRPTFDDSSWPSMVARAISEEDQRKKYRVARLTKLGAVPLGVEGNAQTVWIRRRFTLVDEVQGEEETSE